VFELILFIAVVVSGVILLVYKFVLPKLEEGELEEGELEEGELTNA